MTTDIKPASRSLLATRAYYRAEAHLHRTLARSSADHPDVAQAHLALATTWDERADASEAHVTPPSAARLAKERSVPVGYHTWGPLENTTPAEVRGVSKRTARNLSHGCVRCPCGLTKSVDGPTRYKWPGKPWVAVRPACPLTTPKVPGT
jgi:hypothetical protein